MRIAVLWTHLSGYLNACMKNLASREGVELCVIHESSVSDAPFKESQFEWMTNRIVWRHHPDLAEIRDSLRSYSPNILVIAGWHIPEYRRLGREYRNRCFRVMAMDNSWMATPKQRIGTWIAPAYVRPIADFAWVPGERQAVFARKLGFEQSEILRGLYTCDRPALGAVHEQRISSRSALPRSFLYLGRFVAQKGLKTLLEAYRLYKEVHPEPWPLICCGTGPLQHLLEGEPGVQLKGFVQPDSLPDILSLSGCLVLPSVFEPWAVVIHEACSAGRLVLSSERAGAAVHLVQPGYNGFIFSDGDARGLAQYMLLVSTMTDSQLDSMSRASYVLSEQYSPSNWADALQNAYRFAAKGPGRISTESQSHRSQA